MKDRVTVNKDEELIVRAKRQAHRTVTKPAGSFVERWAGQFTIREGGTQDLRLQALKAKHGIAQKS